MQFDTDIFAQFDKKWALLSAGSGAEFNAMTMPEDVVKDF